VRPTRTPRSVLAWFAILSVAGTLMHIDLIDAPKYSDQRELHHQIVTHTAPAPYQYRILQPVLVQAAVGATRAEVDTRTYKLAFMGSYAGIRFLAILTTLVAVFLALRQIAGAQMAMLGATALAALLPFTYRYYYYQPTSVVEMAFIALGLLAIVKRMPSALLPLVAIGTLNRETMCFVPFAYLLYWWPKLTRHEWGWLAVSALAWASAFVGLRMVWPATADLLDVSRYISRNLQLSRGSFDILVMFSPVILVLLNWKRIPPRYLRLASCCAPWLVLHFTSSRWHEIRYYMPVLIWILPALTIAFAEEPGDRHELAN
jgi:hypothetical protein